MLDVVLQGSEVMAGPRARPSFEAAGLHTAEGFAAIEDGTVLVQPGPAREVAHGCPHADSRMPRWLAALLAVRA